MKVQVHPADEGGCGFYRVRAPAAALAAQGEDVTVHTDLECVWQRSSTGDHVVDVVPPDADVVVLQRVLMRRTFECIAPLQRHGVAVVVDIDDDFHGLPEGHPLKSRGQWSPVRSPRWLKRACEQADMVTVTTPALAERYGQPGRVTVLPNMVPASYLDVPAHEPGDVVGWTGSIVTHIGDLEATGGGVAQAIRDTGARMHIIGTGKGVKERLELDEHPSTTNGWVSLEDYPKAYAGLDVAIVPLALNQFNEAKSDLKGLEALAVGVPFVASPTGPYRELVKESGYAGVIAETAADWSWEVRRLVKDPAIREHMAGLGRSYVKEYRTIEGQAWRWRCAWAEALERARSRLVGTH